MVEMESDGGDVDSADAVLSATKANPHCAQLTAPLVLPFRREVLVERDIGEHRFLTSKWRRMPYRSRPDTERSSCHWGQLKLLEGELKVLTDYFCGAHASRAQGLPPAIKVSGLADERSVKGPLVVYAGAAPGRHIHALVRRFPSCHFELYDPADFDPALLNFAASPEGEGRVTVFRSFFDEAVVRSLRSRDHRPMIFISDIRTSSDSMKDFDLVERCVEQDMIRQRAWVEELRPDLSMLKFRLPWGPGETRYLRGRLLVQAFPPCTSTETRLVVSRGALDLGETSYNHQEYMERLMFHNTVGRSRLHNLADVPLDRIPGLDHCFDCAALVGTARESLALQRGVTQNEVSGEDVATEVAHLLAAVGESGRTLATPYHVSSSRHAGRHFKKRCFVDALGRDVYEAGDGSRRRVS